MQTKFFFSSVLALTLCLGSCGPSASQTYVDSLQKAWSEFKIESKNALQGDLKSLDKLMVMKQTLEGLLEKKKDLEARNAFTLDQREILDLLSQEIQKETLR